MVKRTNISLQTLMNWAKRQEDKPSDRNKEWNDGYDSALSDLVIQINDWKNGRNAK